MRLATKEWVISLLRKVLNKLTCGLRFEVDSNGKYGYNDGSGFIPFLSGVAAPTVVASAKTTNKSKAAVSYTAAENNTFIFALLVGNGADSSGYSPTSNNYTQTSSGDVTIITEVKNIIMATTYSSIKCCYSYGLYKLNKGASITIDGYSNVSSYNSLSRILFKINLD